MEKIVIFSGAGVSQESGVPTYRDTDGIWNKYTPEDVVDISGWKRNPQLVLDFHSIARNEMNLAEPNEAHKIIAELENDFEVTVVTQNIDNLHEKAGSSNVLHLHGEINKVRNYETLRTFEWTKDEYITLDDNLRPHVVWFGEMPLYLQEAKEAIAECDHLIVIGTSLSIGYTLGLLYQNNTDSIWCIDPNPPEDMQVISLGVQYIKKVATEGMNDLRDLLNK